MRSTMMETPLLISRILTHGTTLHAASEVVTWTGEGGARRASYGEVGRNAARLAHALRTLGVTGDQRVATFMWNNQEHLEVYLAAPSMGAVLHTINIRLFPEQMLYVINHAEDHVVVVDNSLAAPFAKLLPHCKTVQHVVVNGPVPPETARALEASGKQVHDYAALLAGRPDRFAWPALDERDAAAMCYTSGTTGNPKGVVYSHRSNYLHSFQLASGDGLSFRQGDRLLAVVPMFHANAWGLPYAALMTGASLVMPDRFLQAEPLARMISSERVTGAGAVPTIWSALLDHLDKSPTDVSSLREVIVGGSACPPALMRAFEERHGVRVLHAWGMTEMSPLGTVARAPQEADGDAAWDYRTSQGRLACSVEARLVGPDGREVPWDGRSVGELQVRGPWITASYYLDADPEKFHDGWLRTGDVGSLSPDGFLRLSDRAKDVIKSGGEWISSVELENHLMAHPAVKEACVVGVPDERWGERPLAAVVLREGQQASPEALRDFLEGKVARWQLPERWAFIPEVPKTSVGKFDKKVLRKAHAEGGLQVTLLQSTAQPAA
jgi:fatty-acyl-CoA synthase